MNPSEAQRKQCAPIEARHITACVALNENAGTKLQESPVGCRNALDVPTSERSRKQYATAQARAALIGISLRKREGGDGHGWYIASGVAGEMEFSDFDAVETWLAGVNGYASKGGL